MDITLKPEFIIPEFLQAASDFNITFPVVFTFLCVFFIILTLSYSRIRNGFYLYCIRQNVIHGKKTLKQAAYDIATLCCDKTLQSIKTVSDNELILLSNLKYKENKVINQKELIKIINKLIIARLFGRNA